MKKKPFILLEVLIAFTLVLLCIVPLVKQPLKLYKDEMITLENMELERLAEWTFTEVKELLLKNEIPWEKIPEKKETSSQFPLPAASLDIPGTGQKTVQRSFTLVGKGEKPGISGNIYRQIWIKIHLNKNTYRFRLPIEKIIQ